jgi:hypothetical protein
MPDAGQLEVSVKLRNLRAVQAVYALPRCARCSMIHLPTRRKRCSSGAWSQQWRAAASGATAWLFMWPSLLRHPPLTAGTKC